MRREDGNPGARAGATGADSTAERLALLEQYSNARIAVNADELHDLLILALDLLDPDTLTARNLDEARAALWDALDLLRGGA